TTLWETIHDTSSYQASFDRIVASVFGFSEKPSLGDPPAYVNSFGKAVAGHNDIDSMIYKLACEFALKTNSKHVDITAFYKNGELIIPEHQFRESVEYLGEYGAFELQYTLGDEIPIISVSDAGFELY